MQKPDKSSDDPSLMTPFRRVVPKHQQDSAETLRAPRARVPQLAKPPQSRSILPIVVVAGCAVLLLMAGIGAALVYLFPERQEEIVAEANLEEDLIAVEAPITLPEVPLAIIDLSGDPVILPRRQDSLRQVSEIGLEAAASPVRCSA